MTKSILFSALLLSSLSLNAQVVLDDWITTSQTFSATGGTINNTINGGGIVGGQRDVQIIGTGANSSSIQIVGPSPGYLDCAGSVGHNLSKITLTYDGNDDLDASTVNATTGFGATDMTGAGAFSTTVLTTDPLNTEVWSAVFRVYSSPTNYSEVTYNFTAAVSAGSPLLISYPVSAFTIGTGATAVANFAAVTAVQFMFNRTAAGSGFDITFQGGITVPSPTIPLPLNWLSFSGAQKGGQVQLDWKVANEKSSYNFNVERSMDGERYTAIGTIKSRNAGADEQNYQFTDAVPVRGLNFYRISQTDVNGIHTYSIVLTVSVQDVKKDTYLLYPSPTKDILTVENTSGNNEQINGSILDMQGKELLKFATKDSKAIIKIGHLNAGNYIVKLSNGKSFLAQKQ